MTEKELHHRYVLSTICKERVCSGTMIDIANVLGEWVGLVGIVC